MDKYRKLKYYFLLSALGIAVVFLFFKYILKVLLPFLISFLVVSLVRPLIEKICKKTKASKFFVTMFVIFLSMILAITSISLATGAIVEQIRNIFESIVQNLSGESNYVTKLFEFIAKIESKIPFISSLTNESIYSLVTNMISEGAKSLSLKLTSQIARMIAAFPQIMVTIIVVFLSLFYFAKDYEKIGRKTVSILPKFLADKAPQIKNDIILVVTKYIKSYMLLLLITFAILISGFLILGIKNSFTLAVIISFVDILPILGVGTVLIPWAIILIIGGQTKLAIGLMVLFAVNYTVRQYAEPRIVSAQMEVHPLLTLFAMYAGLKLAGILGLVFAPLIAFVVKTAYNSFKKEKTVDNQG
ncbi:MAG: sporulation integral membrane protein YtvI [Ruminococcaceae bacterium]|nr:sporulation integral membrane protein YtvI [Oscillospiraceae bacterium]